MGRMLGRAAGIWLVCVAAALTGASAASALPNAAIGGVQDPATQGVLQLSVLASESEPNVALASATALLDDEVVTEVPFEDGETVVTLTVPTASAADGTHWLKVIVENDIGGRFEWERSIEIDNTPPESTPVVTISVGSGSILPSPPPDDGGPVSPSSEPRCASPRLSMFLAQRPLRFRRGVPVLAAGRKYRFTGHLDCRIDGRRRPAPRGTEIQVLHRTRWRTMVKPSLAVRGDGRIAARLAFASKRVVIFRVRGEGGTLVRVQIPIRAVEVGKAGS